MSANMTAPQRAQQAVLLMLRERLRIFKIVLHFQVWKDAWFLRKSLRRPLEVPLEVSGVILERSRFKSSAFHEKRVKTRTCTGEVLSVQARSLAMKSSARTRRLEALR